MGATGATGATGPQSPIKIYTIYLDYTDGNGNSLSRVYLPPGLSTTPSLAAGGIFTGDVGSDLVFYGTSNLSITNIIYAFPIGISATGYSSAQYWQASALSFLGGGGATWQNTSDFTLILKGLTAGRLNGANAGAYRPTSGVLSGWLATLTIYFL